MTDAHRLFAAALKVRSHAWAPYSGFPVGAAILADDNRIYVGCNVENASFPEGWCAETSALGAAISNGVRRIREVAVVAEAQLCTPCGGCRQRLAEFAGPDVPVHICRLSGIVKTLFLKDLLPARFSSGADQRSI